MTEQIERRFLPAEMRVEQDGSIEGYAAVFDEWADLGFFREKIRAGAFKKTIQEADVRALFNHDPNYVLGRNKAGTLELAEDRHGLHFRVDPPKAGWANDLHGSIQRGDINQASFGFNTIKDAWDHDADPAERELLEVRLFDVSVVTYPAYEQTEVSARSLGVATIASMLDDLEPVQIGQMINELRTIVQALEPDQEIHSDVDHQDEQDGQETKTLVAIRRRLVELEQLII